MNSDYKVNAKIFKAISDHNRLKIINMLSCGEKCACDILKNFDFTQPTLSHHMKVLMDSDLVKCRKDGLWSYYFLESTKSNKLVLSLMNLFANTEGCICEGKDKCNCDSK